MSISLCPGGTFYVIQPGDTFNALAARFGISPQAIANANPGVDPRNLQVGQTICIPGRGPSACAGTTYTIQLGDTFYLLAQRFGVTLQALVNANPGVDPARLQVGQTICIPTATLPTAPGACVLRLVPGQQGSATSGGTFWYGPAGGSRVQVFVAAVNLPDPAALGATSYTALLSWGRNTLDVPMAPIAGTPGAWFGTLVLASPLPYEFFVQGSVDVLPGPVVGAVTTGCR